MNRRTQQLAENCDAISELIGELLMVVVAVLAFGVIAVHVLSYQGPPVTVHTEIDGWIDPSTDMIYFRHSGGEAVGTEDLKIIVNLDGARCELASDNVTAILGSGTWQLADIIAVNASDVWGVGINEDTVVDASIVHIGLSTTIGNGVILDRRTGGSGEPPAPTPTPKPTPTPTPPDPWLVSLWHLDENEGGTAYDSIDGNDGTIIGAAWTTGVNGSALLFDGKDDCINCGNDESLDITDEITMMAWVYASSQKTTNIIGKGDGNGYRISIDDKDGWVCEVYYITGSKAKKCKVDWGEGQATLNQWYHVAMTYNGSVLQLYVDGVKNSKSASGSLSTNSRNLYIGSNDAKQKFFDGMIDEVAIYNQALTAEEIIELKEQY
ncbi:MAG: LamG-like jellyroll fold domain-containing protein [Euryarchaeota archaeon]|nr:LamG-like jellyroll fold domain-containing protein [Euryarchaeota archaeon]